MEKERKKEKLLLCNILENQLIWFVKLSNWISLVLFASCIKKNEGKNLVPELEYLSKVQPAMMCDFMGGHTIGKIRWQFRIEPSVYDFLSFTFDYKFKSSVTIYPDMKVIETFYILDENKTEKVINFKVKP